MCSPVCRPERTTFSLQPPPCSILSLVSESDSSFSPPRREPGRLKLPSKRKIFNLSKNDSADGARVWYLKGLKSGVYSHLHHSTRAFCTWQSTCMLDVEERSTDALVHLGVSTCRTSCRHIRLLGSRFDGGRSSQDLLWHIPDFIPGQLTDRTPKRIVASVSK